MLFFYQGTWWDFGKEYSNIARWVALGVMCLFSLSVQRRPGGAAGSRVRTFALAFAAITVFSSAWSRIYPVHTLQRGLSVMLFAVFLCFSLWPRLREPRDWVSLVNVLVASAWVMTLVSVALWLGRVGEAVRWTGAVQGAFGNPNSLGMVYAILVPITLGRFHYRKGILPLALLAMSLVLLFFCRSRAGWLGTFVGVMAFYAGLYGRKLWIPAFIILLVLATALVLKDLNSARSTAGDGTSAFEAALMRGETDSSEYGSGRIPLWTGALAKWKERPFAGYGFGTAGDTYYVGTAIPARFHSSLIQITTELGVVGVLFFIAPIIYSVVRIVGGHSGEPFEGRSRTIIACLAAGWLAGVVDSFFESWFFAVGNPATILAWICFFAAMKGLSLERFTGDDVQ